MVGGIAVWNLLDHISGTWVTVLAFILLALGVETFFFQRWLARKQERGHFANPS
jgi:hypothetical protein